MNYDWLKFWSGITPHKVAITTYDDQKTFTFSQINERAEKLAVFLKEDHHISKGDRICIIAQNCIEYIYLFSAAQKTGIVLVPLNYRCTPFELNHLVRDADPKIIFYEDQFRDAILEAGEDIVQLNIKELQKNLDRPIVSFSPANLNVNDPLFILYTSGSTGIPKGVIYTHKMLFWNSVNTGVSLHINSDTKTVISMPPFHTGGWNVLLTPILHHGGHSIIMKNFRAAEVLKTLSREGCTQFMAVPTMLKMLAEEPEFEQTLLPDLNYIIVGGEPMPIPLIEVYHKKGIYIRQGFGMTEVGPNLTSLHQDDTLRKIGSIGKPNMYVAVRIINDKGLTVDQGERGELCFQGPVVMPGYWNNEEAGKKSFLDGWFRSGDIATQDEEGFLYIVDRIKNMFISGGENVYPAEIEKVLLSYPGIKEVVVIGVPDLKWGEVGKAFIVVEGDEIDPQDIKNYCLERLSKYKIPKHISYVDSIPKNDAGKIDRKLLK
jgi:fatty-acyl-CoA synthase